MPRPLREYIPHAFYHVMFRGVDKKSIYFCNEDYKMFYTLLEDGTNRYKYFIHAFCLMRNHVHLLVQIKTVTLSQCMHNLASRYAKFINKKYDRVGHLFQGRFQSNLVEKDSYLLELVRYIHLNPVSANLVKRPEDHKWNSHRIYLGEEKIDWVKTDFILPMFSEDKDIAKKEYETFITLGLEK